MKKFTAILLALVLVLGLAACSSNKPQNPQPTPQETTQEPQTQATEDPGPAPATINVIYHPTIGGSTAIATAISQGYFEEENLTVNLQMYTSGPPEIAAMVAKQADVGFIGSGAAWLAFSGQVNIIALDNIALTEEIITRADNGINSIADLKGKTVAVQEGAAGYTLLVVALQEAGISVSDVKILNISNDNLASTFSDASIDALGRLEARYHQPEGSSGRRRRLHASCQQRFLPRVCLPQHLGRQQGVCCRKSRCGSALCQRSDQGSDLPLRERQPGLRLCIYLRPAGDQ